MGPLLLVLRLALRNLLARRINLLVGALLLFGTLGLVVGASMLESVRDAMNRSVRGTATGDLQIYSRASRDPLSFWSLPINEPEQTEITDFAKLKQVALTVANVKSVVPMGLGMGMIVRGNRLDAALAKLRNAVNAQRAGTGSAADVEDKKALVRRLVGMLQEANARAEAVTAHNSREAEADAALSRASSDEFWVEFDRDPLQSLEFLDNKIAPQMTDNTDVIPMHYLGADLGQFARSFDQFEIVDGTAVPQGQRGLLLSKYEYEDDFKLKNARRMDLIHQAVTRGTKISEDTDLQRMVSDNQSQVYDILYALGSHSEAQVRERLQKELNSHETDLYTLLREFFKTDDANFEARYRFFYDQIAPLISLYQLRIGESYALETVTHWGYQRAANLKLYGTFSFKGLEDAPLTGGLSLIDIVSFRDLDGYLSEQSRQEIAQMQEKMGPVSKLDSEQAEAALFASGTPEMEEVQSTAIDIDSLLTGVGGKQRHQDANRVYTQAELDDGVVLNVAVLLEHPERADSTRQELEAALDRAGFNVRVIPGAEASGILGKIIDFARLFIAIAVVMILVVVVVVLNNALVMATLQRVQELGTLRAIGAQLSFVRWLSVAEVFLLGATFAGTGALLGAGIVTLLGRSGIPGSPDLAFFFGGPVLHPAVSVAGVLGALGVVVAVSTLSSLYPAVLAGRIQPVRAMQSEE